jgi:hypothetical protein
LNAGSSKGSTVERAGRRGLPDDLVRAENGVRSVLANLKDRYGAIRVSVALRRVSEDAEWYARARKIEKSGATVDTDLADLYASWRIGVDEAPLPLVDALAQWDVQHLVVRSRFRLAGSVRLAVSIGASIAEVEAGLGALHPQDVAGIVALGHESELLGRLRFQSEHLREWLRLLRSDAFPGSRDAVGLHNRRLAALARLDLIDALIDARHAEIEASVITAAVFSSLDGEDAQLILTINDAEWPRERLTTLRSKLKDGSESTACAVLDELGMAGAERTS